MAKTKKHTSLYSYLSDTGVLESGDEVLIQKVKAAYWRNYHKNYKRKKRSSVSEYTISMDKEEQKIFEEQASRHKVSTGLFIKQSAWAYVHQHYLPPDRLEIARLEQTLSLCYSGIERLVSGGSCEGGELHEALLAITRIEQQLQALFSNPPNLEHLIKDALDEKPHYISTLKKLIESHDHKKQSQEEHQVGQTTD